MHGSIVWKFFHLKPNSTTAECRLCSHIMNYKHRSTSNMVRHLKAKHLLDYEKESEKKKPVSTASESPAPATTANDRPTASTSGDQSASAPRPPCPPAPPGYRQPTFAEAIERREKYKPDHRRKKEIDDLIIEMIIKDTRPMSAVEDKGFVKLIKYLDPRYEMISRSTLRDIRLPGLYYYAKEELKKQLANVSSVSITTDSWTSVALQNYTTITAHYIDQEWALNSKVLCTRSNGKAHTSPNLSAELSTCFKEFGIEGKVAYIVTDNAPNIVKAAADLTSQHPCLAHTLNLAVKDALKETGVKELIGKVKSIVTFFKSSPKQVQVLRDIHTKNGTKFYKLKQECETRWNSALTMFQSYITQHEEITEVLSKAGKANLCLLKDDSNDDVENIKSAIKSLKPLKEATEELSSEHFTTASKCVPMMTALKKAVSRDTTPLGLALTDALASRFDHLLKENYLNIATALDPRFKTKNIQAPINNKIKDLLPKESNQTHQPESATPQWQKKVAESSYWKEWEEENCADEQESLTTAEMELQYFVNLPNLQRGCDPLKWWKAQTHALPEMTLLAKKFLAIPGTSVPSERIFSKAGQIVSKRRSSLKPKNVDMLLFLNKNL